MRCFVLLLPVCLISMCCLLTPSYADVNSVVSGIGSFSFPLFDASVEGSSSSNTLSFNYQPSGDSSSLGTCVMNPMSRANAGTVIEELPLMQGNPPVTQVSDVVRSVLNPQQTPPVSPITPPRRDMPPPSTGYHPVDSTGENPVTPEPATLLMLVLGMTGLAPFFRRRCKKQ